VRVPRIYQSKALSSGQIFDLDAQATVHLTKVLRLRVGDELVVFNGEGGEFEATVSTIERRAASIELGKAIDREVESPLELVLVQGVSRGERMDYTVQKAVELGVTQIVPVNTERTVVNLKGDRLVRRQQHWQAVVNGACEQSGRNIVPEVKPIVPLQQWLDEPNSDSASGLKLVLHHRAETSLADCPRPEGRVIVLIGPEGGLSLPEITAAESSGYLPLRLGPRVLRTETAAVAALAILQWLWGDFGENNGCENSLDGETDLGST
jgi:16S rRNA (uracil1498-N3)-methyltransferase